MYLFLKDTGVNFNDSLFEILNQISGQYFSGFKIIFPRFMEDLEYKRNNLKVCDYSIQNRVTLPEQDIITEKVICQVNLIGYYLFCNLKKILTPVMKVLFIKSYQSCCWISSIIIPGDQYAESPSDDIKDSFPLPRA
jgi:hypothetical protein